jgi:nitronate monooxygenase
VRRTGLDPDKLPEADKTKMNFGSGGTSELKAWRDIWSAGQSVSGIHEVVSVASLVDRMAGEYQAALAQLQAGAGLDPRARARRS